MSGAGTIKSPITFKTHFFAKLVKNITPLEFLNVRDCNNRNVKNLMVLKEIPKRNNSSC